MLLLGKQELVTLKVLYRRPDRVWLLQEMCLQIWDVPPDFPGVREFVRFWRRDILAPLVGIEFASRRIEFPGERDMRVAKAINVLQ